ncbi:MAG: PEPxxWA-CTERM sorting domain-containing protein [Sphingomonadaceae bacterium]
MTFMIRLLASAALLSTVAAPATAALTTFTNRAAFNLAAGMTTTETFNSFTSEISFRTTPLTVGGFSLAGFGTQFDRNFIDIPPPQFSVFNIDGTTNVNAATTGDGGLTFSFAAPITSFGADFGAFQDDVIRSFITAGGITLTPPVQSGNTVSFFGFTSDTAFSTVRFSGSNNSDGFSIDNVSYGLTAPVPEPATWLMMLMGFGLVGGMMRRRTLVRVAA